MDKLLYLLKRHFLLRAAITVGLCLAAAVLIGSGLRTVTTSAVSTGADFDQPARLSNQAPAAKAGLDVAQSASGNKVSAAPTSAPAQNVSVVNNNVNSLGQAIKILAAKPANPDGDKSVATNNSNAATKGGEQAAPAIVVKNVSQPETARGR